MIRYGLIFTLLALLAVAGCSSDSGFHWGSTYRTDIHSVCVPIFTTRDYHRNVEFQLTDALDKTIEEFTPYKIEPRERADTILEGEIVSIRPLTLSLNPNTATPQEQSYTVTVNFTWKDLRTGKILVSRSNFEQTSTYFATLGESQFVASQDAAQRLAMGIVHEMEAPW